MIRLFTILAVLTSVAGAAPQKIRSVEGVTEYRLPNGLQVLLFPDPSQSTVTVNITYLVGSRNEGYGETGMAHLLEHMMFKGSRKYREIGKQLDERAQANATTDYDRTNYFETLPATGDNLDWALALEADRMVNADIAAKDLATEFSVVRNEFEMGENDPEMILGERVWSTAYLWHNYGKAVIGARADIEKVPASTLKRFYAQYYQPDDAVLIVSGKLDEAATIATIDKLFGPIPKPTRVIEPPYTVEPVQDGDRVVTLRRKGDVAIVQAAYHGTSGASPDGMALAAATDILGRESSGRLYKKLVETKLATSVSGEMPRMHDPGIASFTAKARDPKTVDRIAQIIETEVEGFAKVEQRELDRWKTAEHKRIDLAMANSQEMALLLTEFIALGDWRTMFAYRDAIDHVTVADVQRVAKAYFKASNRTLGEFLPIQGESDRAPLTAPANPADFVKGVKDGAAKDVGEAFAATLENIEARTKRIDLGNGVRAAFLAKKTRGQKVQLALQLHWGDETSLQGKERAGMYMAALMQRGTVKKSHQDLKDAADALKAEIMLDSDGRGMTVMIVTTRDHLADAIALVGEMATQPAFSDKELELLRGDMLAQLAEQANDPSAIAASEVQTAMTKWPKSDPRYPMSIAEQIEATKKVTAAEIRAYWKDFAGANHGELSVVGDFDQAAITAAFAKAFGGWQSKKPYKRLDDKPWNNPGSEKSILVKDKEQSTFAWGFDLPMRDTDPDYPAWVVANEVLGGYGGSRLWMRVREHEGLSYGVYSFVRVGALDDRSEFMGQAIVAPQNLAKAKASIMDELRKLSAAPPTASELQKAKDAWQKTVDTDLSDDRYETEMLVRQTEYARTTDFVKQLEQKIRAVTAADVQRVAKKYLDPKRLILIDAGDSSKVPLRP
ncbi:MAG: pitrilysin family protein [Kofleriaceae bacterium]